MPGVTKAEVDLGGLMVVGVGSLVEAAALVRRLGSGVTVRPKRYGRTQRRGFVCSTS